MNSAKSRPDVAPLDVADTTDEAKSRSRMKLFAVAATTSVLVTGFAGELSSSASASPVVPQLLNASDSAAAPAVAASFSAAAATTPIVAATGYSDTGGGWQVTPAGIVTSFGGAANYGSVTQTLNKPIVGIAASPDGKGYLLVGGDGGVFAFGDAKFLGSEAGKTLNKPIVGIASTPSGSGYSLVAADGGVFNFGTAHFAGSEASVILNSPIVGIATTPDGQGYWMIGADGGVFAFGDAPFLGSQGSSGKNAPFVGIRGDGAGKGYWLISSDGAVFPYGGAPAMGSFAAGSLAAPVVGMIFNSSHSAFLADSDGSHHLLPGPGSTAPSNSGGTTAASRWPTSVFSSPLGSRAMADESTSSSYVNTFVGEYEKYYGAVGVNQMPIWTVGTGQANATVSVTSGCNDFLPSTGTQIPIPAAAWTTSSDDPIVIWQPGTDTEWELWQAKETGTNTWSACWGGKLTTSSSNGVFTGGYGLSASGISYLATTISEADVASGSINHAIALDMVGCDAPEVAPADRTDCGNAPGQPHEGTWFRLPTSVAMPSGLTTFGQMVFHTLQTYGMVVTDQAGAVTLQAENTADWAAEGNTGTDPITTSWQGKPEYEALSGIPWSSMVVVAP